MRYKWCRAILNIPAIVCSDMNSTHDAARKSAYFYKEGFDALAALADEQTSH